MFKGLNALTLICERGILDELKPKHDRIIKDFEYIVENQVEDECNMLFWTAIDQNCERGFEKFKYLMECAKETKYGLDKCMEASGHACIHGVMTTKNWKIIDAIKEYIDLNAFHDELDIYYGDSLDRTKIFL